MLMPVILLKYGTLFTLFIDIMQNCSSSKVQKTKDLFKLIRWKILNVDKMKEFINAFLELNMHIHLKFKFCIHVWNNSTFEPVVGSI